MVVCELILMTNAGAAAAWVDTIEAFGSGRLSVAEVLEPATRIARQGHKHDCSCYHCVSTALLITLDCRIWDHNIGKSWPFGSDLRHWT
jgi:hypothetical protein